MISITQSLRPTALFRLSGVAFGLVLLACASTPPPKSPAAQPAPRPPAPAAATVSEPAAAAPAPATEPAPPEPPKPAAEPAIPRSPKAILVAKEVSFLVEYAKSDPKKTAETDCEQKAKGDGAKRTACIDKARNDFKPDLLLFKQDEKSGACTLIVYKRVGDNLTEVFRGPVKLEEQLPDKVSIGFAGGKGQRPLFKGAAKGTILVPDDYSIQMDDPQLGKLYYTAKVGLITED